MISVLMGFDEDQITSLSFRETVTKNIDIMHNLIDCNGTRTHNYLDLSEHSAI